ncbi:MAG: TRAP transporter TatT component family protein [Treponemataceae bacterium]|nr:TRAP transporter TatT component family protein [Treponemataceae bacterium]
MMKKSSCLFLSVTVCSVLLSACVSNAVGNALSGYKKNGAQIKKSASEHDPMLALTGETDVILVGDFFPTALKMYEILQMQNPDHLGLAYMTGSLNVMYANAFVQTPAESLGVSEFDKQNAEFERAKLHYLRGRDLELRFLDGRHKGFSAAMLSGDNEQIAAAVAAMDKNDVDAAYWCGAGWLAAFSLDILNPDLIANLGAPLAILNRATEIDPDYNNGAIWDVLFNFYMAAPGDFGGDPERGMQCYEEELRVSGGRTPGPYVTYAWVVCVSQGDEQGFDEALDKALAIDPNDVPATRLMTTIAQNKARYLKAHKGDYFVQW